MPLIDEVNANVAVYHAALRAKAKNPLTVSKLVDLKRVDQDINGERSWNADALVAEVKRKYPDEFESELPPSRPEPPKQDARDAFEMSEREFDAAFRTRFPWSQ